MSIPQPLVVRNGSRTLPLSPHQEVVFPPEDDPNGSWTRVLPPSLVSDSGRTAHEEQMVRNLSGRLVSAPFSMRNAQGHEHIFPAMIWESDADGELKPTRPPLPPGVRPRWDRMLAGGEASRFSSVSVEEGVVLIKRVREDQDHRAHLADTTGWGAGGMFEVSRSAVLRAIDGSASPILVEAPPRVSLRQNVMYYPPPPYPPDPPFDEKECVGGVLVDVPGIPAGAAVYDPWGYDDGDIRFLFDPRFPFLHDDIYNLVNLRADDVPGLPGSLFAGSDFSACGSLWLLVCASTVTSAIDACTSVFYVSSRAPAGGDGTKDSPWNTVQSVRDHIASGLTVNTAFLFEDGGTFTDRDGSSFIDLGDASGWSDPNVILVFSRYSSDDSGVAPVFDGGLTYAYDTPDDPGGYVIIFKAKNKPNIVLAGLCVQNVSDGVILESNCSNCLVFGMTFQSVTSGAVQMYVADADCYDAETDTRVVSLSGVVGSTTTEKRPWTWSSWRDFPPDAGTEPDLALAEWQEFLDGLEITARAQAIRDYPATYGTYPDSNVIAFCAFKHVGVSPQGCVNPSKGTKSINLGLGTTNAAVAFNLFFNVQDGVEGFHCSGGQVIAYNFFYCISTGIEDGNGIDLLDAWPKTETSFHADGSPAYTLVTSNAFYQCCQPTQSPGDPSDPPQSACIDLHYCTQMVSIYYNWIIGDWGSYGNGIKLEGNALCTVPDSVMALADVDNRSGVGGGSEAIEAWYTYLMDYSISSTFDHVPVRWGCMSVTTSVKLGEMRDLDPLDPTEGSWFTVTLKDVSIFRNVIAKHALRAMYVDNQEVAILGGKDWASWKPMGLEWSGLFFVGNTVVENGEGVYLVWRRAAEVVPDGWTIVPGDYAYPIYFINNVFGHTNNEEDEEASINLFAYWPELLDGSGSHLTPPATTWYRDAMVIDSNGYLFGTSSYCHAVLRVGQDGVNWWKVPVSYTVTEAASNCEVQYSRQFDTDPSVVPHAESYWVGAGSAMTNPVIGTMAALFQDPDVFDYRPRADVPFWWTCAWDPARATTDGVVPPYAVVDGEAVGDARLAGYSTIPVCPDLRGLELTPADLGAYNRER